MQMHEGREEEEEKSISVEVPRVTATLLICLYTSGGIGALQNTSVLLTSEVFSGVSIYPSPQLGTAAG